MSARLAAALLVVSGATLALAGPEPAPAPAPAPDPVPAEPAPPTVAEEAVEAGTRVEAVLPGRRIVATAFARAADGTRVVVLAARADADEAAPALPGGDDGEAAPLPPCPDAAGAQAARTLWTFSLDRPDAIRRLAEVPAGASRLEAVDVDGDGVDELLVAAEGAVWRVASDGSVAIALEDAGAALDRLLVSGDPDDPRFAVARRGALELYAPHESGVWKPAARVALPLFGHATGREVRAVSPVPRLLGVGPDGAWILALRPEAVDTRRIRVRLARLGPGDASGIEEAWARLPQPERPTESSVHLLDGEPVLVALTRPADKMSFFGDRGLRVWPLARDRSRLGRDPWLVADTAASMMQSATPHWIDVNGDGALDLVLAYYRGMVGRDAALEVWLRTEDGSFERRRRTTAVGVKDAQGDLLAYGDDVDGDGVADLVVRADDRFRVHPGWRSERGKDIVQERAFSFPAPETGPSTRSVLIGSSAFVDTSVTGSGGVRVRDVDGDGRAEIVAVERGGPDAPARLVVLRHGPATGTR